MARVHPKICANCEKWDCFEVDYGEFPEDECGSCEHKHGEVVYGDDEACDGFIASKVPRVRAEDYWM